MRVQAWAPWCQLAARGDGQWEASLEAAEQTAASYVVPETLITARFSIMETKNSSLCIEFSVPNNNRMGCKGFEFLKISTLKLSLWGMICPFSGDTFVWHTFLCISREKKEKLKLNIAKKELRFATSPSINL